MHLGPEQLGMGAVIVGLILLFVAKGAWNLFCQPPEEKQESQEHERGISLKWRGE